MTKEERNNRLEEIMDLHDKLHPGGACTFECDYEFLFYELHAQVAEAWDRAVKLVSDAPGIVEAGSYSRRRELVRVLEEAEPTRGKNS